MKISKEYTFLNMVNIQNCIRSLKNFKIAAIVVTCLNATYGYAANWL